MNGTLATAVADFLAHKRALGRKYLTEEATLRLRLVFADQHGVASLGQLTPQLLDEFVASRPRARARSFNHLVAILGCFLDWAVTQQRLEESPLRTTRRRETARRLPFLFDPAGPSTDHGGRSAPRQPEGHRPRADLPHHLRSLLRPRSPGRGVLRPSPRRRRPAAAASDRARWQVRQESSASPWSPHRRAHHRAGRASADRGRLSTGGTAVQLRRPAQRAPSQREPHVPPARPRAGLLGPRRRPAAPSTLPASLLRRGLPVAVVSRGSRPLGPAVPALHVHGPCRPRVHRDLPDHHSPDAHRGQPTL